MILSSVYSSSKLPHLKGICCSRNASNIRGYMLWCGGWGSNPRRTRFHLVLFVPLGPLQHLRFYYRNSIYINASIIETSMREYIFTPHEREILKSYLATGEKFKGFRLLKHRIKKNAEILKQDMLLIDSILQN